MMTFLRGITFAIVCAVFLLIMFSFLPDVSWDGENRNYPVYQPKPHSSSELVDFLVASKLNYHIHNVNVVHSSLRIDFLIEDENVNEAKIYDDFAEIIFEGFKYFSDIAQLRIRFIMRIDQQERFLIGIMADRKNHESSKVRGDLGVDEKLAYMNEHFQISYGPLWQSEKLSPK